MFAFFALVFSILLTVQAGDTSGHNAVNKLAIDPKAFVTLGGRNYYIPPSDNRVTKAEADVFCKDLGMELVSLETEEESRIINYHLFEIVNVRSAHWTSGIEVDGEFHWMATDQPFTYTLWGRDEPTYEEPGACVVVMYAEYWKDTKCSNVSTFICEQYP